jgi:hypothetical protein
MWRTGLKCLEKKFSSRIVLLINQPVSSRKDAFEALIRDRELSEDEKSGKRNFAEFHTGKLNGREEDYGGRRHTEHY